MRAMERSMPLQESTKSKATLSWKVTQSSMKRRKRCRSRNQVQMRQTSKKSKSKSFQIQNLPKCQKAHI